MYNYVVDKLQNFKLQIQYMVNKLHERNLLHPNKIHGRNQTMYNYNILHLNKLHDRNQTMYNYMVVPLQHFKLHIQPKEVTVYDLSLSKITYYNIFVSSDLYPDIDTLQGITSVFSKPSNIDPQTSRLQTQTQFFTPLSCDLETDTTEPKSRKRTIT